MRTPKIPVAARLEPEWIVLLDKVATRLGLSRSDALRVAVERLVADTLKGA